MTQQQANTHLSPQERKIMRYLQDHQWHCMANPGFYIKDDRRRITDLNRKGFTIQGEVCDRRCGVQHSSGIFMRRWVSAEEYKQGTLI